MLARRVSTGENVCESISADRMEEASLREHKLAMDRASDIFDDLFYYIAPTKRYNAIAGERKHKVPVESLTDKQCKLIRDLSGYLANVKRYFEDHPLIRDAAAAAGDDLLSPTQHSNIHQHYGVTHVPSSLGELEGVTASSGMGSNSAIVGTWSAATVATAAATVATSPIVGVANPQQLSQSQSLHYPSTRDARDRAFKLMRDYLVNEVMSNEAFKIELDETGEELLRLRLEHVDAQEKNKKLRGQVIKLKEQLIAAQQGAAVSLNSRGSCVRSNAGINPHYSIFAPSATTTATGGPLQIASANIETVATFNGRGVSGPGSSMNDGCDGAAGSTSASADDCCDLESFNACPAEAEKKLLDPMSFMGAFIRKLFKNNYFFGRVCSYEEPYYLVSRQLSFYFLRVNFWQIFSFQSLLYGSDFI